jgi:hypothetical protein
MYCGAQLAPNAAGCGNCGRPIAMQQQGYPPPPAPPQGFAPPPPQQQGYPPPQQQGYPPPQQQGYPPQQQGYQQPPMGYGYTQPPPPTTTEWKFGYSRWIGIHYGPIPIGIIIAVIILIALAR